MITLGEAIGQFEWTHHGAGMIPFSALALALILSFLMIRRGDKRRFPIAPGALPFIGHALSLSNSEEFLSVLTTWAKKVGQDGIFEFSLFGQRWIVLCSADTFMEAFRHRPYKIQRAHMMSNAVDSLCATGLFNAEGQQWKTDRRLVGPALNKNHLQDYFHSIKLVSDRLVSKWAHEGGAMTAFSDLSKYSLDIVALSILGLDIDSLNNPSNQLANDIENLFRVLFTRSLSPVPFWKIPFCGNLDGGRDVSEAVLAVFRGLVHDYRRQKEERHSDNDGKERETRTFLKKLIDISDGEDAKLDEERVVGNLAQLIIAGTDTSSTTLGACIWEIANDPVLQRELHDEVAESGLDLEGFTLNDSMNGFPRLHSFVFEVLRLKGPGPFFFLEPGELIELHGEVIGPGTIICAMTQTLGEKAASEIPTGPNGEGPKEFCPQRWLIPQNPVGLESESLSVRHPSNKHGSYMPFGHGLRVCPGAQFAKVEVIAGLFCILRQFDIAPIQNHPPLRSVTRFTQTFDGEIQLVLKSRS